MPRQMFTPIPLCPRPPLFPSSSPLLTFSLQICFQCVSGGKDYDDDDGHGYSSYDSNGNTCADDDDTCSDDPNCTCPSGSQKVRETYGTYSEAS